MDRGPRSPRPVAFPTRRTESNGKARAQAKGRVAYSGRQEKETEARQMKELDGYVKIIRELGGVAVPTRH